MVNGTSSNRIVLPTTAGSAPNRRCQKLWLDYGDRLRITRPIIFSREGAPERGLGAKHREKVARDFLGADELGVVSAHPRRDHAPFEKRRRSRRDRKDCDLRLEAFRKVDKKSVAGTRASSDVTKTSSSGCLTGSERNSSVLITLKMAVSPRCPVPT